MYTVYSILLFLSLFYYIPAYLIKHKIIRKEKLNLKERLSFKLPLKVSGRKSLWIHAVSVGEVLSLRNLIVEIKKSHPDWIIYFSSLTNTGMKMARKKLNLNNTFYIPFDFKFSVNRFFLKLKPDLFILAESEFWPNILRVARKKTKGVILINGRISKKSYERYKRLNFLSRILLSNIKKFLVQTEGDKIKLEKIGVTSDKIEITGNLKSELIPPYIGTSEIKKLRKELNISLEEKVFVAGSTHRNEEQLLMSAFSKAKKNGKDIRLIIAPRQTDRFDEVYELCRKFPYKVGKKSMISSQMQWEILVLDTIGDLAKIYAISDAAFIGGSLVPWGGHNLLEPAFYSKPIYFGPYMDNFDFLANKFLDSGAAELKSSKKELVEMFSLKDTSKLEKMGKIAKMTLDSLQGATEKTIKTIEKLMNS